MTPLIRYLESETRNFIASFVRHKRYARNETNPYCHAYFDGYGDALLSCAKTLGAQIRLQREIVRRHRNLQ